MHACMHIWSGFCIYELQKVGSRVIEVKLEFSNGRMFLLQVLHSVRMVKIKDRDGELVENCADRRKGTMYLEELI